MAQIAGSLQALLTNLIDYAGLYPPAALPLPIAIERYQGFLASPERWILNRLVLPAAKFPQVALREHWHITLVVDEEPGPLPPQVETLETKLPHSLSLPTYCEVPLDRIEGSFAKLRTGGLTPEAIPPTEQVAAFLTRAAVQRVPFKATAGLHHAIRSNRSLTYKVDSPRAVMHGFLNVFLAAAFAWHGMETAPLIDILNETDAGAFEFADDCLGWHGHHLTTPQVQMARREFAHSFGSCSFEEPVSDLHELDLLP
jgi:hypothetical protein